MLLEALDAGNINRIGLGAVEGRYFLFHCGVGPDAAVVEQVEPRSLEAVGRPSCSCTPSTPGSAGSTITRRCVSSCRGRNTYGYFSIIVSATPTFLGNRAFELVPELTLSPLAAVTLEELNLRTLGPVAAAALAHRPGRAQGLDIATGVRSLV